MYCNDLSFLKTAGICNHCTRLITVVYRPAGEAENYHDESRCCPTPEDPEMNARSWWPHCLCLRELESAFCSLRCLLINLDDFQQCEGPHLLHFLPQEKETWPDCHFSTQFDLTFPWVWQDLNKKTAVECFALLTCYNGNINISRITYVNHF